jgi:hypothetical protein
MWSATLRKGELSTPVKILISVLLLLIIVVMILMALNDTIPGFGKEAEEGILSALSKIMDNVLSF